MKIRHPVPAVSMLLVAAGLCACSTLSREVRSSAVEFSVVMEEFSNQVLVTNLLRAQDQAPLNFSDLPTISGALALKASTTLTLPFGARYGTGSDVRKSAGPMIDFSSTPTFDTTSMNTQAFTLSMIQPVSPVYIESLWNSGIPQELLLYLFVESIHPPGGGKPIRNDPDAPQDDFETFKTLVSNLITSEAELRSFTVVEPLGLPYAIQESGSASAPRPAASQPALANVGADKYLPLLQLDPNHFKTAVIDSQGGLSALQIYRRYPSQIAFCVRPYVFRDARFSATAGQSLLRANNPAAFPLLGSLLGSRRSAILDGASALKGAPTANGASVLLDKNDCKGFEKFAKPQSPTEIEKGQDGLGYVRWRSTADIFRYLGSVLRKNRMKAPVVWGDPGAPQHELFDIVKADEMQSSRVARITVNYLGSPYSVASLAEKAPSPPERLDHSLQVLALLNQLVNAAKHSEDTPTPRTLQVLP